MGQKICSPFTDFWQVKLLLDGCFLNDCFWDGCFLDGCFLDSCFWPLSLQNSLRRNWMLRQPLLFGYWLPKHPVFWFTSLFPTQSVRPPLTTYSSLCSTGTYRTLCHARVHRLFPPTLSRKCYGFERSFFTLKRFLPCTPSCCFQGFPGDGSLTSKVVGLHVGTSVTWPKAVFSKILI